MDAFRFDGKRVLVLGGASGMGNAAARLADQQGGDVTVLDVKEPVVAVGSYAPIDLREESAIDAALDGLDGPFHALMSCSGVADGTPGLPQVNFIGQRHFIESAIDRGIVPDGGAIGMISSIGGSAWPDHLAVIQEFLDTPDFATVSKWIEAHPERGDYTFSKQAMVVYCARRAPRPVAEEHPHQLHRTGPDDDAAHGGARRLADVRADLRGGDGSPWGDPRGAGLPVALPRE